jgi:zinc protease
VIGDEDPDLFSPNLDCIFHRTIFKSSSASKLILRTSASRATRGVGPRFEANVLDKSGNFTAFAIFAPQNLGGLEIAFKEELEKVRKDGISDDELKAAKPGWLQGRQVSRGRDSQIARTLADYLFYNRTFNWDAEMEKRAKAVTAVQAAAALRKYIDPAKLTVVTAGSFATVAVAK